MRMRGLTMGIASLMGLMMVSCGTEKKSEPAETEMAIRPHIVFVMGDEEYRSEESMPMLARIVERELGAKVSLCYSVDSLGYVDPNRSDHIEGLSALDSADAMVLFTRFRALPPQQLAHILNFAESGKPMIGFRTATHPFLYPDSSGYKYLNEHWPAKVFGQQWITHHGHFEDGDAPLTAVTLPEGKKHPILKGVNPFQAYSWLYHVQGGGWELQGDSQPLLWGESLRSKHAETGALDQYPLQNPVAWTKTYKGESGKTARVFFSTLGHPYDWRNPNMRRLALNGICWALEMPIPSDADVSYADIYEPNNSGFGQKFKKGMRPVRGSELTD